MKETKVAIIGATGWVGKAVNSLFPDAYLFTQSIGTKEEVNKCDVAFICVPTPYTTNAEGLEGKLDTSIVEEIVSWCMCPLIVIRSTINPGTCDKLYEDTGKHIVFQPEYLGETPQHPLLNQKSAPFIILGGDPADTRKVIELYTKAYNANIRIRQMTAYEAEVVKLTENRAIGFKVAQCQELYDVCEKHGVDYYVIREAVYGDDPRFDLWWTFIYPEKRGFNSKCIPKDIYAWCAWAESLGYKPDITRAILERNKKWISPS